MIPQRYAAPRRALLVFGLGLVMIVAVYGRTPTAFLRGESGWFLCTSHADEATRRRTEREFFTHSVVGHYTPLSFLAEFRTAAIVGPSRAFWRWRQLFAVAILGAVLFGFAVAVARIFELERGQQLALGGAIFALMVFQPPMVDFILWPFMIMQLAWLTLSVLALWALIRVAVAPRKSRWSWMAAAAAYASLHACGLGLITVAGVSVSLGLYATVGFRRRDTAFWAERRGILAPCVVLLLFGVLHAWAMIHLLSSWQIMAPQSARPNGLLFLKLTLGFIFNFACAGLRSFTLTSGSVASAFSIAYCWPLGLLLVCAVIRALWQSTQRTFVQFTPQRLIVNMILLFSASGFGAMVVLIAVRQIGGTSEPSSVLPQFGALPRYVIPLQFLFIGPVILGLIWLVRRVPRLMVIGCSTFVLAAIATQIEYRSSAMPALTKGARVSHYTAWRLLVAATRECRAAGLPLPNFSLEPLTEFPWTDVTRFLPLLRRELQLTPDEQIEVIPLNAYLSGDRERYIAAPSVRAFEKKLDLARD